MSTASRRDGVAVVLLALPWLWPLAGGPSASVEPWMASALCVALLALWRGGTNRLGWVGLLIALPLGFAQATSPLEPAAMVGGVMVVALAASIAAALSRDGAAPWLVRAWWIAALASTVIALIQYFGLASHFAPWVSATEVGTAYGNLRQRNQFASLTAIGVAALLWEARRGERMAWIAALAFCLGAGNAASVSRTGLVELFGLGALVVVWPGRSRPQALVVASALGGYVVAAFGLPALLTLSGLGGGTSLWARVAGSEACSSRSVLWSNVLHLIAQRPWTGWGWGELDYAHYVTLYPGARFCDILDNAHNLPLHIAVELGVPVAVVLCGLAIWATVHARPWREADNGRQLGWSVLMVIVVHSLLEYPLWYGPFQIAFGLALGLLWPRASAALAHRAWRAALPAATLACLAFAGWDYWRVSQVYMSPEARAAAYREDPLAPVRGDWLFRSQVQFADLTLSTLTTANATWTYELASELLHYSPEPRIIQKIVESGVILHRDADVAFHLQRWQAAFPDTYAPWAASNLAQPAR